MKDQYLDTGLFVASSQKTPKNHDDHTQLASTSFYSHSFAELHRKLITAANLEKKYSTFHKI